MPPPRFPLAGLPSTWLGAASSNSLSPPFPSWPPALYSQAAFCPVSARSCHEWSRVLRSGVWIDQVVSRPESPEHCVLFTAQLGGREAETIPSYRRVTFAPFFGRRCIRPHSPLRWYFLRSAFPWLLLRRERIGQRRALTL